MRYTIIKFFYILIFTLIVLRLGYWQIIRSEDLTAMGEGQRTLVKDVRGLRGDIQFVDGSTLATNEPSYLLFYKPKEVITGKIMSSDDFKMYSENVAEKLSEKIISSQVDFVSEDEKKAQILSLTASIFDKINPKLEWVSLGVRVDNNLKKTIESLNLQGVGFEQNASRYYPEGSSSAHLLGFLAADIYGLDRGYFGIEGFYDGELKGKKGVFSQERDALGLPILIGKFLSRDPKDGKTLVLNVDRSVQHILEEKLKKGLEKYGAKGASGIIMEPDTGKILAMASFPNYDPGDPTKYLKEYFRNPITADGYEPGSTFKVLVMAAAINEGLVKADTKCDDCSGPINLAGFTLRTWNNQYRPELTMAETIIHSDNTGMVFAGKKLGIDKIYSYIKRFGFGELTGVDLQDESAPDLRERADWKEIDLATTSFGQGISVTALQVVRAVGAIANGGKIMEPQVVSAIKDGDKVHKINPRVIDTPINKEAADTVKHMMIRAVDEGEAQFYKKSLGVASFKIAGKTGTAQIPVAGHYDPNKTIASFVGFAPADNPKFVMLIRYDQPSSSIYGADTAAPTFFDVAKELFVYWGIPPTE